MMTERRALQFGLSIVLNWAASLAVLITGCGQKAPEPVDTKTQKAISKPEAALTFTRDIAPIVFESCTPCHYAGETSSAPFPLTAYREVRSHASQIVEVTASRFMPPWLVEHSDFALVDDPRLSDAEIVAFRQWLEAGAPEGDPGDLPDVPVISEGWQLGEPDLIVRMPEEYQLAAEGPDEFRNFVVAIPITEERWVRTVELRPLNPRAIHHAELEFDSTDGSRRLDDRDPLPGFGGMEPGDAAGRPDGHFYGWVPGRAAYPGDNDVAWRLKQGTDLVLKLHMFPTGKPERVSMDVGFHFNDRPPTRSVTSINLGTRSLEIPAGDNKYAFAKSYVLPVDVKVLAVAPHAHYLGKTLHAEAILPGERRRSLFQIPNWDFNWQGEYVYSQPIPLPRGTRILMHYTYDNSSDNVRNPNTPPKKIVYGPKTTDEMGDLNIRVETVNFEDRRVLSNDVARNNLQTVVNGLRQEVARDPNDVDARASLAGLMLSAGNDRAAERQLNTILEIEPRHVYANSLMGALLIGRNQLQTALEHLNVAIEEDPDHPEARQNLAAALVQMGNLEAAAHHMLKAVDIRPSLKGHFFLGNFFYSKKKWKRAEMHLTAALAYDASLSDVRFLLAKSQWEQGKKSEAIEALRETLRRNPGYAKARRLLQEYQSGEASDDSSSKKSAGQ